MFSNVAIEERDQANSYVISEEQPQLSAKKREITVADLIEYFSLYIRALNGWPSFYSFCFICKYSVILFFSFCFIFWILVARTSEQMSITRKMISLRDQVKPQMREEKITVALID